MKSFKRRENIKVTQKKQISGITLISLVVTIIVLIILAGISFNLILGENGIIAKAQEAKKAQEEAIKKENEGMDEILGEINNALGVVTNPYDAEDWEYAWVYDNGAWGEMLTRGQEAKGDVVAKFYKTGEQINLIVEGTEVAKGDEYHLVIEGEGTVGVLMDAENPNNNYAWMKQVTEAESFDECLNVWVTKLIICDDITNIPDGCLYGAYSLNKVTIGKDVTSIGVGAFGGCLNLTSIHIPSTVTSIGNSAFVECRKLTSITIPNSVLSIEPYTFSTCESLTNITIPNSVKIIGDNAFEYCTSLASVVIPDNVSSIGNGAFSSCTSLSKIKFLTEDVSKISVNSRIFLNAGEDFELPEGSVIYVLSEEMKTKLEGTYDESKTTVEVATLEEMNNK